ncbi:hypothetical protein IJG20_02920 [Candidatus Saccharibacteria bacterium]|nr:hypothetical protein [Candidatus Saccharibacteria bacterium]
MSKVAERLSFATYSDGFDREDPSDDVRLRPGECKKDLIRGYWLKALEMTYKYGDYVARRKLLVNVLDPNTYHKVEKVFVDLFGGDVSKLRDRVRKLENEFYRSIDSLNEAAKDFKIETYAYNAVEQLIYDQKIRNRFRNAVKRHCAREDEPFSIFLIPERDFRKRRSDSRT